VAPFIHQPPERPPDGACSVCDETTRVWRFAEQSVSLTPGYTAILAYAICRACIEVILQLVDVDND
jgi:hypothetical protein